MPNARHLRLADPAPALGRGLTLLQTLDREGACSLEQLVRVTGWPKSSVARLLRSLIEARVVRRDTTTRRFHAVCRLTPIDAGSVRLRPAAAPVMADLAARCGQTVELHTFNPATPETPLTMIDRCEPPADDAPVRVVARVGSHRSLDELDALAQVVLTWGGGRIAAPPAGHWAWQGGRKTRLSGPAAAELIDACRRRGAGADLDTNTHGVRREAAPIRDARGELVALLAVARFVTPATRPHDPALIRHLRHSAQRIADEVFTPPGETLPQSSEIPL